MVRVAVYVDGFNLYFGYLDALRERSPLVKIKDGRFQERSRRCRRCGSAWTVFEEKETDVNIAVALLADAVRDRFDTALVVSADSVGAAAEFAQDAPGLELGVGAFAAAPTAPAHSPKPSTCYRTTRPPPDEKGSM